MVPSQLHSELIGDINSKSFILHGKFQNKCCSKFGVGILLIHDVTICIVTAVTSGYELNQMPGRGALRGQDDHLLPRASRFHNCLSLKTGDPSTILSLHRLRGLSDWFEICIAHVQCHSQHRTMNLCHIHPPFSPLCIVHFQTAVTESQEMNWFLKNPDSISLKHLPM